MRISDWSSDVCSSDLRAAAVVILFSSVAAAQSADQVAPVADTLRSVEAHEAALPANAGAVEPAQQTAVADATAKAAAYVPKTAYDNSPYRFNAGKRFTAAEFDAWMKRSEEHTSELQSLMRISYAVFCLNKKKKQTKN